jgi:hypothetical protein
MGHVDQARHVLCSVQIVWLGLGNHDSRGGSGGGTLEPSENPSSFCVPSPFSLRSPQAIRPFTENWIMEGGGSNTPFYRGNSTALATNPSAAAAAAVFLFLAFSSPNLHAVSLLPPRNGLGFPTGFLESRSMFSLSDLYIRNIDVCLCS